VQSRGREITKVEGAIWKKAGNQEEVSKGNGGENEQTWGPEFKPQYQKTKKKQTCHGFLDS
jgi:hypothetical protein